MSTRKPILFVVSGAHGVGKTTTIEHMVRIFKERGMSVHQFHHVTDTMPWKSEANNKAVVARPRRTWWRRLVPALVKMAVASARDEWRYIHGVNRIVREAAGRNCIALSDRYAYDRLIDLRLRGRPLVQRAAVRIVCSVMPRPALTMLLTDDPAKIVNRKRELTETQIAHYQYDFLALCRSVGAPVVEVPVAGRDANAVAQELVRLTTEKT